MIGLDTNILVRYIVHDDAAQTQAVIRLIQTDCTADSPGYITLVVLCELVWVLDRGYKYDRRQIAEVLRGILDAEEFRVEHSDLAWRALNHYESEQADYADYIIALRGLADGAAPTVTLDQRAGSSGLFRFLSR